MLQLAEDLEIFHLTRHAKERKDRSSTSFSPPFELFLRQHRSSAVPRRLSLFLSLWHCYDITWWLYHGSRPPAWIQHAFFFFFVSLYLRPLLTNEELSICSRTFVTSSMTATIEVLVLVVFLVFASVLEVLQSISSALLPADIACEPGKVLRKLLLRVYDRPLPISVSDRSHPAFVEALSYFLAEKVPLHWIYFPLSNCCSPTETGMSGRSSLPTQWRRWPADKMHQASTLERGLIMIYLCSTLKKTHWLGH